MPKPKCPKCAKPPRKKKPTHDNEVKINRMVKEQKSNEEKVAASISTRRSYLSAQQIANYKNEVDRLTGEIHDKPHLTVHNLNAITRRRTLLQEAIKEQKLPIIGGRAEYFHM
jgi:hypothetical protein